MKIGRRLAIKVLNASKFVLSMGVVDDVSAITRPLDLSMRGDAASALRLEQPRRSRTTTTPARSNSQSRSFGRSPTITLYLVKERAYGGQGEQAASSRPVLALSVHLRLFAPFLPFTTEEVWSWVNDSSWASWPQVEEFSALPDGDPGVLEATGQALSGVRKVKSEQKVSMRARRRRSPARVPISSASGRRWRICGCGSIEGMNVTDGSETLQVEAELAPWSSRAPW